MYPLYPSSYFYNNYSAKQYIVSIDDGKSCSDFQSYMPNAIYMDERPNLLYCDRYSEKDGECDNRLKSILFQIGKYDETKFEYFRWNYRGIICSEDWFIGIGYGKVEGEYLEKDWRAKVEFDATKEYLESLLLDNKIRSLEIDDVATSCLCKTFVKKEKL